MISSNFTWSFQPFQKIYLSYRLLIGLNREGSSHRQRFCFLGGIVWDFEGVSRWNTCNVLGGSGDLRPQKIINFRESSFNMTRGGWRYWGGAPKIFRHPKGALWKNCCARRGAPKICILQNQHMTSSYRSDGFLLNNLMTCATQLYHVVYRYNKCSLSNYYTLVHPKNSLENCITTVSQVCHSINHWRQ